MATDGLREHPVVDVLIPALDEEAALPLVLADLRRAAAGPQRWLLRHVVVIDNGSTDRTADVARSHGAVVLSEPRRGYGAACLRGLGFLEELHPGPDIVVFLDGDRSDDAAHLDSLIASLRDADLVIGSRALRQAEPGSLLPAQRLGNWLATACIRLLYGVRFTDLGPFRAVRYPALLRLGMTDQDYGWTAEMQVKAARLGLRCAEVPVRYRRRAAGRSKISATMKGTLLAGSKILTTIFRHAL